MKQDMAFLIAKARNEHVRRAIRSNMSKELIQKIFGISDSDYTRLAGQVRSGFIA